MMRAPAGRPSGGAFQLSSLKLKPQEKFLLMVGVVLLLAAGFLFSSYRQAQAARERAVKQQAAIERSLASVKKALDLADLQKKKADLEKELSGPANPWAKSYVSLDIDTLVSGAAVQSRVEVVKLARGKEAKNKLEAQEYLVDVRQVQVRGELANIVRLLDQIERGPFPTLRLENMRMKLDKGTWGGSFDIEIWRWPGEAEVDRGKR